MLHSAFVVTFQLASRAVLPILGLGFLGTAVIAVFPSVLAPSFMQAERWDVDSLDDEERLNLVIRCSHERGRLMDEMRENSSSRDPRDVVAIGVYCAIENEFVERAKMDRVAAYHWMFNRIQGKSLHDL